MAVSTLPRPDELSNAHTPATLLDAYEAGRMTRPELLDHLLEWRKTSALVKPHRIEDALFEAGGVVNALRLMHHGLDDDDAELAFHMVIEDLAGRINIIKAMVKGESADAVRVGAGA
ncbi:hypothetical protein [Sphingosinicella sp.]|uniref:hypothetical protein n=1 Tax=Sphingosinicella sp. TaxID=1917971 RepID=UPI0017F6DEA1|nr:hypothetical protein [Sphingosinicella sp.]MBA4757749.1 hypothetical protein [Sphingosinicella sp.]